MLATTDAGNHLGGVQVLGYRHWQVLDKTKILRWSSICPGPSMLSPSPTQVGWVSYTLFLSLRSSMHLFIHRFEFGRKKFQRYLPAQSTCPPRQGGTGSSFPFYSFREIISGDCSSNMQTNDIMDRIMPSYPSCELRAMAKYRFCCDMMPRFFTSLGGCLRCKRRVWN